MKTAFIVFAVIVFVFLSALLGLYGLSRIRHFSGYTAQGHPTDPVPELTPAAASMS